MELTSIVSQKDKRGKVRMYFLFLTVCSVLFFLIGLGNHDLWNPDEPRVAGITAEMARDGDLVIPRLNKEPFLEKPPLYFWASSAVMNLLGENAYTARLISALSGLFGVLVIFVLARSMGFSPLAAFLSGFVLATSPQYWDLSRRCLIDMTLCFFIACCMASYFQAIQASQKTKTWSVLFVLSLSCAVLTKALVGLVIPLSALSVWLIIREEFSLRPWALLLVGSVLCFIPFVIWLVFLYKGMGWGGVYEVVWTNNFGRFSGSRGAHIQPLFYYLYDFPSKFLPWTLFIPLAAIYHFQGIVNQKKRNPSLFILAWFIAPFVLLSFSAGKRGIYLIPLFPAMALFVGTALGAVLEGKRDPGKWYRVPFLILLVTIFLGGLACCTAGIYFHRSFTICLFALPVFCLSIVALRHFIENDTPGSFRIMAVALGMLLILVGCCVYPMLNQEKSFVPLFQYCEQLHSEEAQISLLGPKESVRGAAVFYLKRNIPELHREEEAKQFLETGKNAIILCEKKKIRPVIRYLHILKSFDIGHRTYVLVKWKSQQNENRS
jgi:4-amino-4-deoxy-L-arabinose transferase-like glycosyltransferase